MPTHASLVTPERVLFEGEAEAVVMRAEGGDITFLPNHADFIGAVDICVVRIDSVEEGAVRAAVAGGFVHVAANRVTVLASVAELSDEIDVERARRALEGAKAGEGESSASEAPVVSVEGTDPSHGEAHAGAARLSPTMLAIVHPDRSEVRARRAQARLDAAGASDSAPGVAPH